MTDDQPYVTIRARQPVGGPGARNGDPSSAARAFPNRGRSTQRYKKVEALLLHWGSDDLFVLPELEDLQKCLSEDYAFDTDIFAIPSENSHLELMMRVGQLIKEHESPDTLFLVYYGGHARIDESRQSTWCATREPSSPWLQWSAIQTLLERSKSDVLILLDCCAGAASATFSTGNSITETISASSWDAIAPDPGRYSFTNALIEVLQEWRSRTFSAAMLHAEVLARLKHPRPITINGKLFEARSTPVHFMMTANHKAPSIELCNARQQKMPPSPPLPPSPPRPSHGSGADPMGITRGPCPNPIPRTPVSSDPNEDTPHVMISLALEDDQRLDINAWEQWLSAFPSLAKHVKVQGVFKSHSTLLLVSMPVMIWDMLPEDHATSFVAFIRSNNLAIPRNAQQPPTVRAATQVRQSHTGRHDTESFVSGVSGTTFAAADHVYDRRPREVSGLAHGSAGTMTRSEQPVSYPANFSAPGSPILSSPGGLNIQPLRQVDSSLSLQTLQRRSSSGSPPESSGISRQIILNQQQAMRRTVFGENVPEPKRFASHVEKRLEEYYQHEPLPNDAQSAMLASNLGIELWHLEIWFHHRRERDIVSTRFASMKLKDTTRGGNDGPRMILPTALSELLELSLPGQILPFDLRSTNDFNRSHLHGALNLRAPQSFLQIAPLDIIERCFNDEESRKAFAARMDCKCILFYSKGVDSPSGCPTAGILLEKLRSSGWVGDCFILRGNFREFSVSFDKFVVGSKATPEARAWSNQWHDMVPSGSAEVESKQKYAQWLEARRAEDGQQRAPSTPEQLAERAAGLESQERELEAEFREQHNDLYRKARDLHADHEARASGAAAELVEHLDRGLGKLRGALAQDSAPPPRTYPEVAAGSSKRHADDYAGKVYRAAPEEMDGYVEVPRASEVRPPPGHTGRPSSETGSPQEDMTRRGRSGGSGLLTKVFRRS
ncbi:Rhodanese-like protein [Cordyceps militaris CM01]|uniref:Rhodanese-like protein n=1 Tax=Cordyceps militaris (strain CM01) TaxID=983644 RepID=G3JQ02_CORMM|nr:Rhodanese-like protein [Cordyceps militaris CM01]EGX89253.1 Rhodanese-like protein [Cordyceps militaris CM01]